MGRSRRVLAKSCVYFTKKNATDQKSGFVGLPGFTDRRNTPTKAL
jgi:hypothetical protein